MAYSQNENPSGLNDFGTITNEITSVYALLWSNTNSELRRLDHEELIRGIAPTNALTVDADRTMTSADAYLLANNAAFTASRTFTLPDPSTMANQGLAFWNLVGTDFTIAPASGDYIGTLPINKSITLKNSGEFLWLRAYAGGRWHIVGGNHTIYGTANTSATIGAGGYTTVDVTVTGAATSAPNNRVSATISYSATSPAVRSDLLVVSAVVTAADTVRVCLFNPTGGSISLSSHTVTAWLET